MKHVLRLLTLAGAVVGAVWYARQHHEHQPAPAGDWAGRPKLKAVPEPSRVETPEPAAGRDDLTDIKGIGPKYAEQLADLGINSFAALAATDPVDLSRRLGPRAGVEDWIAQAKDRAQS